MVRTRKEILDHGIVMAARQGRSDEMKALLEQGGSVNARDAKDRTPLMLAALRGYPHVVKLLLEHGADPYIRPFYRKKHRKFAVEGFTALRYATLGGRRDIVKMVVEHVTCNKEKRLTN